MAQWSGKTLGEIMLDAAISEARWEVRRRRIYLALAVVAVGALIWIAIK